MKPTDTIAFLIATLLMLAAIATFALLYVR